MRHGSDKLIFLSLIMNYPGPQHGETVDRGVFCVSIALSLWQQQSQPYHHKVIGVETNVFPVFCKAMKEERTTSLELFSCVLHNTSYIILPCQIHSWIQKLFTRRDARKVFFCLPGWVRWVSETIFPLILKRLNFSGGQGATNPLQPRA